jgi:hypothetical protein
MAPVRTDLSHLHMLACVSITESMNMILIAALDVLFQVCVARQRVGHVTCPRPCPAN